VLLGDEESPFPSMLGMMMKYLSSVSAMFGPISHSFS
jgi:hypothetical protein